MICYKDKTFCVAQCTNTQCDRKLTKGVIQAARAAELNIAVSNFSENCKDYRKPTDASNT